ncbi:MAG: glycosyltransferase [Salinisphaera sp.]|nr:glycosyltransferase [Salinisphaera sp.]
MPDSEHRPPARLRLAIMAGSYDAHRDGISVYIENLLVALLRAARAEPARAIRIEVFGSPGALGILASVVATQTDGCQVQLRYRATRGAGLWSRVVGLSLLAWRRGPYDLVVLPNLQPLLMPGRKLSILHDLTYRVASSHFSRRRYWYMDLLTRLRLRADAAMGVISQTTRAHLRGYYPASQRRGLLLLPNGLPHSKLGPRPARAQVEAGVSAPKLELVFCGRLNRLKGVDRLLDLAQALDREAAARGMLQPTLHLVGKATAESEALLRGWHFQHLTLHRHGYLDDDALNRCYQRSSFAVFLPRNEGFGLPLVEAMWMGAVPLVSDIPIFAEILGAAYPRFGGGRLAVAAMLDFMQRLREEPAYRRQILDQIDDILQSHADGYDRCARAVLEYASANESAEQAPGAFAAPRQSS